MSALADSEIFHYTAGRGSSSEVRDEDPFTTEIIRSALNSCTAQMMHVLIRTAFSTVLVESRDFAIAIYDPDIRLMAQAQTMPGFVGTMNFCIEDAVAAVGGPKALRPGDAILYNLPYGTGSHAQDAAIVMPAFLNGALIGYVCNKAHWKDIGAKDPYCTDTIDVFQEGLVLPGTKLYKGGELDEEILRIILANSRTPRDVEGDIQAQVTSARLGTRLLATLLDRFGAEVFWRSVERMYDHGEALMRAFISGIPDGRYVGAGYLDDNGVDENPIRFEIAVEVAGSTVRFDFTGTPDAQRGPVNCPLPSTVAGCRLAMAMLARASCPPNEGFFRPLEVVTRQGSMFHPVSPQPCYLYGWPMESAIEALMEAFTRAADGIAPAGSAGDIVAVLACGYGAGGYEDWMVGCALPVGQGGHATGDGSLLSVHSQAFSTLIPMEVEEAKTPVLFERMEIIPDSCGPGRHRGGAGWLRQYKLLADSAVICTVERTRVPPQGQRGGGQAAANRVTVVTPDGKRRVIRKITRLLVPSGTILQVEVGGGGGYGPPSERDPASVRRDLREGYISTGHARQFYSHALQASDIIADIHAPK
jgi:N-methylhydantoinase B